MYLESQGQPCPGRKIPGLQVDYVTPTNDRAGSATQEASVRQQQTAATTSTQVPAISRQQRPDLHNDLY